MKKYTLIAVMFIASTFAFSQTTLDTAVNFTATDTHGIERNLFEILDAGQHVAIDFFFVNCVACNETVPYIREAYELFGCNASDVFVMSVSVEDDSATCIAYDEQYGIEFPIISGIEGGGAAICDTFNINSFPTYILIAPDHSIIEQDMWPISNTQQFITYFENAGLEQSECEPASITYTNDNHIMKVFPNPSAGVFEIELNYAGKFNIDVISVIGESVYQLENTSNGYYHNSINLSGLESGMYFVSFKSSDETIVKKLQLLSN